MTIPAEQFLKTDNRESMRERRIKKKSILFINASPNKNGNTAKLAKELLAGKEYETQRHIVPSKVMEIRLFRHLGISAGETV